MKEKHFRVWKFKIELNSMVFVDIDEMYEKLLEMYKTKYPTNPKLLLYYKITELVRDGRTREEAIKILYEKEGELTSEETVKLKRELVELSAPPPTAPAKGFLKTISKYFIHGSAFSIIMFALIFVWFFVVAFLIAVGLLIGLAIGLVVLLFILSGVNGYLTDIIWSIPTETEWLSLLGHGFVLFIALTIAHIPAIIINLTVPSLVTTIALFIVNAFIDGLVAKNVARWWGRWWEEVVTQGNQINS